MSERIAATTLADVRAALTERGMRPGEVHHRVGRWSKVTVRHALRHLVAAWLAQAEGPDCQRLYSRAGGGS